MHLHVQMTFWYEKQFALWTLRGNICNSSSANNMAIQHTVATYSAASSSCTNTRRSQ